MSTIVKIIRANGSSINLSDGSFAYRLADDGLGMSPLHRLEERGALQDGATDLGYRLDPRLVHLNLQLVGTDISSYWSARQQLMNFLRPGAGALTLSYTVDHTIGVRNAPIEYLLTCNYYGDVSLASSNRKGFNQNVTVTLRAADPTWVISSLNVTTTPFTLAGSGGTTYTFNTSYKGNVNEYPIIDIQGPLSSTLTITNTANNKILRFASLPSLAATSSNHLIIDLRYGHKTVVDENGNNKLSVTDHTSDLAGFCLDASNVEVSSYTNNNIVVDTGTTGSTAVFKITYYDRFIGI